MTQQDVLVIGSGGREYELARQMQTSQLVRHVFVAPGNGGTNLLHKTSNIDLSPTDAVGIVSFAREKHIGTVIIGPDAAVAAGVGNALREAGIPAFGPTREAGRLESSKAFAAEFMRCHAIPQPESQVAHSLREAQRIIRDRSPDSYVIKADGLAAGKGVILPTDQRQADQTLRDMFTEGKYGGAGKSGVVIQERLHGPELSAFAVTDGSNFVLLPLSQDHKRLFDHDQGPNTGGMGAYAPIPKSLITFRQRSMIRDIVERTIHGMAEEGTPYQGVLYIGLMLPEEQHGNPVVIEYNARFGDPEAQVVLSCLSQSGFDVAQLLLDAANDRLPATETIPSEPKTTALTVCLAAAGYPDNPRGGDVLVGLGTSYPNVVVQHAATEQKGKELVTSGGRVLYVTGFGKTVHEAATQAYSAIGQQGIHFAGMHYRQDIGHQACT
ncbi:MAG TPA: phosphoribosylamine--glycine ligase [Candidatus Saccharimonadales bacterium]|nr:phosphoribosylamine--glycine ligase [Candidatus Saccharimonadales bacterium]